MCNNSIIKWSDIHLNNKVFFYKLKKVIKTSQVQLGSIDLRICNIRLDECCNTIVLCSLYGRFLLYKVVLSKISNSTIPHFQLSTTIEFCHYIFLGKIYITYNSELNKLSILTVTRELE